jgi:L-threonylcarbamoyladenylate synthase
MKSIKVNKYRLNKRALQEALEILHSGGMVIHPSESSYGCAVDPRNPRALKRLFQFKKRSVGHPVLLAASSIKQAEKIVKLSPRLKNLAKKYWPGPLTIVASAEAKLDLAGTGHPVSQIAIRVPTVVWLRALAENFDYPVTSTSVNLSGRPPAYTSQEIRKIFSNQKIKPDLLLDVGHLPNRPPTTIVRERGRKIEILRQGIVKIKN